MAENQGSVPNVGRAGPMSQPMEREVVDTGLSDNLDKNQNQNRNQNRADDDNNSGGDDDLLADFWNSDEGGDRNSTPQSGNQTQQQQQAQSQQNQNQQSTPNADTTQALQQIVKNLEFPEAMSEKIMNEMAEGNTEGFNNSIRSIQESTVQQTLQLTGQMLQQMHEGIISRVESLVGEKLNERDNSGFLANELPKVDATTKPVVQALFKQAMTKSKGDKQRALQMTRQMLSRMGLALGEDKQGSKESNNQRSQPKTDWASELGLTS